MRKVGCRNTTGGAISDIKTVRAPTEMELEDRILMAPIPKPPHQFSDIFREFVKICLVRDPEKRPDVAQLIEKSPLLIDAQGPDTLAEYVLDLERKQQDLRDMVVREAEVSQKQEHDRRLHLAQALMDEFPTISADSIVGAVEASGGDRTKAVNALENMIKHSIFESTRTTDKDRHIPRVPRFLEQGEQQVSSSSLSSFLTPDLLSPASAAPSSSRSRQPSTPHPLLYQPESTSSSRSGRSGHRRSGSQQSYFSAYEEEQNARTLEKDEDSESVLSHFQLTEEEISEGLERVIIHEYDPLQGDWVKHGGRAKREPEPFSAGEERRVFKLRLVEDSSQGDGNAKDYVVKFFKSEKVAQARYAYHTSVEAQAVAESYAMQFNREMEEDILGFVEARLVEFAEQPGKPLGVIEPFFGGNYRKFNDNRGGVVAHHKVPLTRELSFQAKEKKKGTWARHRSNGDSHSSTDGDDEDESSSVSPATAKLASLAQSFSHFTYDRSRRRLVVCDLQGVGNLLTDPQIHTCADKDVMRSMEKVDVSWNGRFGQGDQGLAGVRAFFETHECNEYCRRLHLTTVKVKKNGSIEVKEQPGFKPPVLETASSVDLWRHFRSVLAKQLEEEERLNPPRQGEGQAVLGHEDVESRRIGGGLRSGQRLEKEEDDAYGLLVAPSVEYAASTTSIGSPPRRSSGGSMNMDLREQRFREYQQEDEDEALRRAIMESKLSSPSRTAERTTSNVSSVGGASGALHLSHSDSDLHRGEEDKSDNFIEYARYLGIDPEKEVYLLGIAQEGFDAPLPAGWSQHIDAHNNIYFYNAQTKQSTWEHPLDQYYKQRVEDMRSAQRYR
uniref:Alpha-type protein kinase domain-containing protein n=1 Tax=Palpitomonas bilix TaxID=652834 RepID=A0A7S3D3P1_9EUKA